MSNHPSTEHFPLLSPVLLLGSMFLAFILSQTIAAAADAELRVLSYNIRYLNRNDGADVWDQRKAAVFETLRTADVIGLQEVVSQQLDDIRRATPELEWYGVGRNDGKQDGESVPIGWNREQYEATERGTFWLSPTPDAVGSRGWDAALPRIASWVRLRLKSSGVEVLVLNAHFDHRGEEARRQSAIQIREWLSEQQRDEQPVIMMGDLNATLEDGPLRALLEPFKDAEPQPIQLQNARTISAQPDPGPNSTWNGFQAIEEGRRIDFILVGGRLEVLAFETLNPKTDAGRFASDHLPVRARIGI